MNETPLTPDPARYDPIGDIRRSLADTGSGRPVTGMYVNRDTLERMKREMPSHDFKARETSPGVWFVQ